MPSIKLVIFDMDGVLIDSEPIWIEAEVKVFAKHGMDMKPWMCKQTKGMRLDEVITYWSKYFKTEANIYGIEQEITEMVIRLVKERGQEITGAKELLNYLIKSGYTLALASSSCKRIIQAVVEKLNIKSFFKRIESAQELSYGKPHPEIFINTASAIGVPPSRCIVVEDSFHGIIAAIASKMQVIGLAYQEAINQKHYAMCDYQIQELKQIQKIL